MKPSKLKTLIIMVIAAGLVITQGCGGSKSNDTTVGTGNTDGVTITNEVSSPAEMNVGDILMLQFGVTDNTELSFDGVDGSSKYYLVVGSLDSVFGSHSASIDSISADFGLEPKRYEQAPKDMFAEWTTADAFHQRLRDFELSLALDPEAEIADSGGNIGLKNAGPDLSVSVGDVESFRVLNSLTTLSSYADVRARARCVKSNVIIYVDTEVEQENPDDLSDEDLNEICENFNDQVTFERSLFGNESDVNGDGKVAALLTPQVNRLGALGGGIITGFFLASDLFERSGSNQISNEREIVYTMVPDSAGKYGIVIPVSFGIDNLLTAVLPHEFQHVISYNQHVFLGEGTPEEGWLNEAMSHLTEDLVGFGQENPSRVNIFLNDLSNYQLVAGGSPNLGERGASYLFMRFLYEQHPDPEAFLAGLYNNNTKGVANVEAAYNGSSEDFDQFGEFFMRWMTALAMTNQGLSSDTRYVYEPRTYNEVTQRWQGVCLVCDADDGRGTILSGPSTSEFVSGMDFSLYSSTMEILNVETAPVSMTFSGSSSSTFGAVLIRRE